MWKYLSNLVLLHRLFQMGCYGIGVTRLLQAMVEHSLMRHQGKVLWPRGVAPFTVYILPLTTDKVYLHVMLFASLIERWVSFPESFG